MERANIPSASALQEKSTVYENDDSATAADGDHHLPAAYANVDPPVAVGCKKSNIELYGNSTLPEEDIPEFVPPCSSSSSAPPPSTLPPSVSIYCPSVLLDRVVHVTALDLDSLPTSSWIPLCPMAAPRMAHVLRFRQRGAASSTRFVPFASLPLVASSLSLFLSQLPLVPCHTFKAMLSLRHPPASRNL